MFENASYSTQMQYNDVLKNIFDDDPVSMRIVVTVGQNETFDPSLTMVFDDVHVFQSEFEILVTSGRPFFCRLVCQYLTMFRTVDLGLVIKLSTDVLTRELCKDFFLGLS